MRKIRSVGILLLFACAWPAKPSKGQGQASYPSIREIQSLLSETERAWQQFRPLLDQKQKLLAKSGTEAAPREALITYTLDVALPILGNHPPEFNGPEGFMLVESLFDASREAAMCASTASTQARLALAAGRADLMGEFDALGKRCSDASTSLYAVGKSAGALYLKFLEADQQSAHGKGTASQKPSAGWPKQ